MIAGPADPIQIHLGPGAGGSIAPGELESLAQWYLSPQPLAPRVRASMVATVDGAASVDGVSGTISPAVDRSVFRVLRALSDVILVGAGTARAEDYGPWQVPGPLVAGRRDRQQPPAPVIAQVSRSGRVHTGRGLFQRNAAGPPGALAIVARPGPAELAGLLATAGADAVIEVPGEDGGVDLAAALAALAARGLTRVLCEGGPSLLAAMVAAGLVDELCLTTAPLLGVAASPRILDGGQGAPRDATLLALASSGSVLLTRWLPGRSAALV